MTDIKIKSEEYDFDGSLESLLRQRRYILKDRDQWKLAAINLRKAIDLMLGYKDGEALNDDQRIICLSKRLKEADNGEPV